MPHSDTLRGIILREAGDELIVQASPADIRQFAHGGADVILARGKMVQTADHAYAVMTGQLPLYAGVHPGDNLFDRRGLHVAVVTEVHLTAEVIDTTHNSPRWYMYRPGTRRTDIRAVGVSGT